MSLITLTTRINAPVQRCFDCSLSVALHLRSTAHTGERVVAGPAGGILRLHDVITWEAVHLGFRQRLTVRITEMNAPVSFTDEMVSGAFKSMHHEHFFREINNGTEMEDRFRYEVPFGAAGRLFDRLYLYQYMKGLLVQRNNTILLAAENDQELIDA